MIRAAALLATFFFMAGAQAKPKPGDDGRREQRKDDTLPELPLIPGLDAGWTRKEMQHLNRDFAEMTKDLSGVSRDLHRSLAAGPRSWDSDDEDEGDDSDARDEGDEGGRDSHGKMKIYKINPWGIEVPHIDIGGDEREYDEREATARAKGRGTATLEVKGPVTFQVRTQSGEVEVVATDRRQVSITLSEAPPDEIALFAYGDRIEPSFRGRRTLRRGKLHVELPRGSRLDLASMSGDVVAQKIGDVRIRSMSGDVKLSGVGKADVQTISGDALIDQAAGPVRLHTVSGKAVVTTAGTAPQLEFQSASGSLEWTGICGKDCHLSAETVSGQVRLSVDPKSSFELSYTSHSGELRDELDLAVKRAPRRKYGMASGWLEASYGKGEGVIEADAFSGNLVIRRR